MVIAIIGITGFQLYWLGQNYIREKKAMTIKTEMAFRESILQLQAAKLNLNGVNWDGRRDVKIFMSDGNEQVNIKEYPKTEIISTINVIRDKLQDSLEKRPKRKVIISMNKTSLETDDDTNNVEKRMGSAGERDHILNLLYGVDSLQEPLQVAEIDSAFAAALKKEKLDIPYTVSIKDSSANKTSKAQNEVTIGFAHPSTFQLQLGNSFTYLIKRISQPILFSVILLGITILSFVLLYRNLLEQRRLAELKNEFISNITHELKTPIATAGVAIEALKNFNAIQDPRKTMEYLDISSNELQRLGLLVDKVLKLSMFENKEIELKYESVDLKNVVDEVVASMKLQLEKNHAQVSITADSDLVLNGDKLHLQSVIFNLLDNAIKYGKENPEIKIDLKKQEDNIILSVADNGIGISPEYKDKVFDKFFRIPHGDTHDAKGYGLGLSYVMHVVKKHKGVITMESKPGIGTKFLIELPAKP